MEKYFAYLEELRHSSATNDPQRASEILRAWMDSYRTGRGNGK